MNIKRNYVLMGLVLLLIVWTGNIFYYQKHVLKEPLFIKHYYDVKQGMENFRLFYIDSINQREEIAYVTFPELGQEYTRTEIFKSNSDNRYYNLNIINVIRNVYSDNGIPEGMKNKVLTKARVYFTNGNTLDVDIGRIYLYSDGIDKYTFDSVSGMGSSDNTGNAIFSSPEDLKIYGVSSKFPELMDELILISINGVPLREVKFPINVKKGDTITVEYKFRFDSENINRNNAYEFPVYILTENEAGIKGANPVFVNYWLQSPEEYDIPEMLKNRGDD